MLPALARFNREKFCAFFPEISGPLIAGLRKDKEVSLIAFGQIAMVSFFISLISRRLLLSFFSFLQLFF
jgi:hypothetical protein